MNILFLGKIIPMELENEVRENSNNTMQDAAISLQQRMIDGLDKNKDVNLRIINRMPVFSFPRNYKKPIIHTSFFSHKSGEKKNDVNLGFVNICYIKQLFGSFSLKKHLNRWIKEEAECKRVISYTLDKEFLRAIKHIKKSNPSVKSCAVVADLPEYIDLSSNQSILKKIYSKYNTASLKRFYKYVDSYVLLTEQMADKLMIKKPYVVVEGIATETFGEMKPVRNKNIKDIFYAGTLHKRFGVLKLLEAFEQIHDDSYRLTICGIGDCENVIKEKSESNSRIRFFSLLKRSMVLELMQQATVVINPRQNNEEFAKYSFPSKNLEALSSGVPFIAYKLDGIPHEYDNYINYVPDDSTKTLADKIVEICEKSEEERRNIGESARVFVSENKNSVVQMNKVTDMLRII